MKLFLSYNKRDFRDNTSSFMALPSQLKTALNEALDGDCTFLDVDSIHLGSNWRTEIETKLRTCKIFVVLAGPNFFRVDQFKRLSSSDSVIRYELLTAYRRRDCVVMPVFCGTDPPHRTGQRWPNELEWLSDVQWLELPQVDLNRGITKLTEEVCRELSRQALQVVKANESLVNCISVLSACAPEERKALQFLLTNPDVTSFLKRQTPDSLTLLINYLNHGPGAYLDDAIAGRGLFVQGGLLLRLIYVLSSLRQGVPSLPPRFLEQLDHSLQNLKFRTVEEQFFCNFLLMLIQRSREHLEHINLQVSRKLWLYFADFRRLPSAKKNVINNAIRVLISNHICISATDNSGFLGETKLAELSPGVRVVKYKPRRKQTKKRNKRGK